MKLCIPIIRQLSSKKGVACHYFNIESAFGQRRSVTTTCNKNESSIISDTGRDVMVEFRYMNTVRQHEELESWPHLCSVEMEGGGAFQQSILQPKSIYNELELADIFGF